MEDDGTRGFGREGAGRGGKGKGPRGRQQTFGGKGTPRRQEMSPFRCNHSHGTWKETETRRGAGGEARRCDIAELQG